jgi:FixJ family two-component response regulator
VRSHPKRVACIDDDPSAREALEGLLRSCGHEPRCFCSAEEFLDAFEVEVFACIITDVRLERMSGLELVRRLADDGSLPPTIAITALDDALLRENLIAAGSLGVLLKPFREEALLSLLAKALGAPAC